MRGTERTPCEEPQRYDEISTLDVLAVRCSFIFIHLCASDSIDYLGSKFVWLPVWLYVCMKYTYTYCGTGRVSERTNIIDCCLLAKVVGSGGRVEWWALVVYFLAF